MNETALIEKLIKIEALFAGAATVGEKISAERARQRILDRLKDLLPKDPPVEYKFTFPDMWSRKVFTSLLRRYDLKPYRYHRQRYTTVMVQVPKTFVDETLWPEFQKINSELGAYLQEVTDRVVKEVLHKDSSDAEIVDQPLQIEITQSTVPETQITTEDENTEKTSHNEQPKNSKKKKKRKKKRRGR